MGTTIKILLSGGGTGGHIFPAIAIADEIRSRFPDAEFLFVGANGKMEMEKVPQAGYKISGLNIAGFNRGNIFKNISLPYKIISSLLQAKRIIKDFAPDFAVGTGGFASGPALYIANQMGVPTFIQEQNSLPGKTNIFLSRKAETVFTAYPDMNRYFAQTETCFLGNPVRKSITADQISAEDAKTRLGLNPDKLLILSVGGSLGSKTLNDAWTLHWPKLIGEDYQLLWQTGKTEYRKISTEINAPENLIIKEFIFDMELAYAAADLIVSRAGAIAISELAIIAKPVLLVPFPFAAEDHQTKNAQTLVNRNAAMMVKDSEMQDKFFPTLLKMCKDQHLRHEMTQNIRFFAKPKATKNIVDHMMKKLHLEA